MVVDYMVKNVVDFYSQADEVWIPQASVEETLREYGYKGRVEVVDNGNDFAADTRTDLLRSEGRAMLGAGRCEPVLLFVGSIFMRRIRSSSSVRSPTCATAHGTCISLARDMPPANCGRWCSQRDLTTE